MAYLVSALRAPHVPLDFVFLPVEAVHEVDPAVGQRNFYFQISFANWSLPCISTALLPLICCDEGRIIGHLWEPIWYNPARPLFWPLRQTTMTTDPTGKYPTHTHTHTNWLWSNPTILSCKRPSLHVPHQPWWCIQKRKNGRKRTLATELLSTQHYQK
jgi:hypothetical protein